MIIVEPMVVVAAVCAAVIFMREMPRLFAWMIVRLADRLSAARQTDLVEALNGRLIAATWVARSEDRKLLSAAMRSTMRVSTFRSLYPVSR